MPNILQRAAQAAAKSILGYRFGTEQGVGIFEMLNPPEWDYKKYLKAYGQIGWLYAVCSVRANNIAVNPWRLYRTNSQGERDELDESDKKAGALIKLLKKPNPYQTRYEYFYQHQNYKDLVGESFWQMNFNGKGLPVEMWLAPPAFMNVIPSPTDFIAGYQFKRGTTEINFKASEIIHIMHPDPSNPYRGISPAQALTLDLSIDLLSKKHQEKVFFNNAIPALVVSYKAGDGPKTTEQRKELEQSFDERFRGVRNAGKSMFAYGSDVHAISIDNHQLDYINLGKMSRDDILGAYNTHPSIVGISENVNRANAEAANYQFALQVVEPELNSIREEINEKLCPFFDDYIEFDYDNPVSEDVAQQATITQASVKQSIMSLEEARETMDLGDITPDDHFLLPPGWQVITGQDILDGNVTNTAMAGATSTPQLPQDATPEDNQPQEQPQGTELPAKGLKKKSYSDDEAEPIWKSFVASAEAYEKPLIGILSDVFTPARVDALQAVRDGKHVHIDETVIRTGYVKHATPIITACLYQAIKNGSNLVSPKNPHKSPPIPPVVSQQAIEWLKTRMTWAAEQVGDTLAKDLADSLAAGYAQGESITDLTTRVQDFFNDSARAQRIARTETITASNQGALYGYKEAGCDQCEFYTAQDERTCETCNDLNHEVFNVADADNIITGSTHPNCRCCFLPVIN